MSRVTEFGIPSSWLGEPDGDGTGGDGPILLGFPVVYVDFLSPLEPEKRAWSWALLRSAEEWTEYVQRFDLAYGPWVKGEQRPLRHRGAPGQYPCLVQTRVEKKHPHVQEKPSHARHVFVYVADAERLLEVTP